MRRAGLCFVLCLIAACAARQPTMTRKPVEAQNLIGSEWLAEDIGGAGVVDRSHSTLRFAAAGKVDGDTGCNRFMGPLAGEGSDVRLGPLATTRRACAPALMDQERRYLVALAQGVAFELDGTQLLLLDDGRQALVRYSRLDPTAVPTRP